ncbi:hypothetical protein [Methylocystis sp. ATCC 49242]|uniref:hypothetical protein n=1 Tax=Methylocystis sp. ATCC 49242 TaxID=622637 RepID=UPI0001F86FC2|nr:hypothetical protein [Methylocystis sp. ATCC 49242]
MPLNFTGKRVESPDGVSIQATDAATGKPVVVKSSHMAIQDYGMSRVEKVASDKYDKGKTQSDGSVRVHTDECS